MRAYEIGVTTFRQILILPLTLTTSVGNGEEASKVEARTEKIAAVLEGQDGWSEREDHLEHLGDPNSPFTYAEFVYFHPFIQRFLYDREPRAGRPLRLFQRRTAGELAIDIRIAKEKLLSEKGLAGSSVLTAEFNIDRLNLYLFTLGVAILAVEVSFKKDLLISEDGVPKSFNLAHALALQNALRRIYPPYFIGGAGTALDIPEFPSRFEWVRGNAHASQPSPPVQHWLAHVRAERRNPLAPAWQQLLAPLQLESGKDSGLGQWRQVIDERLPTMICIGVRKPEDIEPSDWVRLCFCDDPGLGFPYNPKFLADFEARHAYDPHFHGDAPTRYLFSGFSMIMVGTQDPPNERVFFGDVLVNHFRRHYFQMGLLIYLQFAALLALSHRVSDAVENKSAGDDEAFRESMLAVESQFLAFEQRYWFTQVSNQMQAREIYDLWIERTGVRGIHAETRDQIRAANAYLDARALEKQTNAGARLTVIATFGVIFGAAMAFLGMNVITAKDVLLAIGASTDNLSPRIATLLFTFSAFFGAGWLLLRRYGPPAVTELTRKLLHDVGTAAIVLFILAYLVTAFSR